MNSVWVVEVFEKRVTGRDKWGPVAAFVDKKSAAAERRSWEVSAPYDEWRIRRYTDKEQP